MSDADPSGLIRLREYEKLHYSRLGEARVRRLEQITEDLGVPIFRFLRTYAQAQQYVGVVQAGDRTIQILPKIYERDEDNLGYLVFLLGYTRRLKLRPVGTTQYEKLNGSFLEVWIQYFATELNRLLRTQWKLRYVEVEEHITFLRGKLLVERELTGTGTLSGRYACRYELFTKDHLLNQVLKFCNALLLRQTRVSANRRVLEENSAFLSEVAHRPVRPLDLDRIHLDRLSRDYEPLLDLCRLLLEYSTLDMNRLFEEFVAEFLRRHLSKIRIGDNRHLVRVDYQHHLGQLFGEFNMHVDLVLTDDTPGTPCSFLVDTKYKALDIEKGHVGLSQDDFYQMYAYGTAGKRHYEEIILLYPTTDVERRSFIQGDLRLHVSQFDPRAIYDNKHRRVDTAGAIIELSRALSYDRVRADR